MRLLDVERVIIAFSNESEEDILAVVRSCRDLDLQIDIVPRLYELVGPRVAVHTVEGFPLVGLPPVRLTPSTRLLKRSIDIFGALVGLVLTAPVFALRRVEDQAGLSGPGLLPADAARREHARVHESSSSAR